ncbi:O-antigen ligase family protein [Enterobacteriaceae bacterium H18W14]|uniref:O-antigen ligase family protein n=1 Tax=Dryocola boscaweniae TaxID=2925397 RepID=UPI0022F03862|nr:O-antigen ligase family protein [Dryocola boscaweniae]MCT4714163.1 O-antigen ligase family protein [Dryocola boscaweniae]
MLLNKKLRIEKIYIQLFVAFMFFSAIFCNISKINLLFHSALIIFIGTILFFTESRHALLKDRAFFIGLILSFVFLLYYSASNLWSQNPSNITSSLKQSFYLLSFILLYRQTEKLGCKKYVIGAVYFGMILLSILTFMNIDSNHLLTGRLKNGFPWAPDNVIDLGGYMAIGILCGLVFIRDTGKKWLYLFIPLLFASLLLTQSRGPLIALILSLTVFFLVKPNFSKKHILSTIIIFVIVISAIYLTKFSDVFVNRLESSYQQSFIRFGIWQHTLELVKEKWIFGWGYDKDLAYKLSASKIISTTHTIYLASILKGGIFGFGLLIIMLGYGLLQIPKHLQKNHKAEVSIFIFSIFYYMTQGMFIIGNPQEFWLLFWFPLAIILSAPIKQTGE